MTDVGIAAFEYHLPAPEAFARAAALGVTRCEIVTPADVVPETVGDVAVAAKEAGVAVTAVASLSKPNAVDDPDDVARMIRLLDDSITCADALGSPYAITYFGGHPSRPEAEALERYVELVAPSVRRAEQLGVTVLIENHFSHAPGEVTNTARGCRDLIDAIGSPAFALNFDYCNFAIGGQSLDQAFDLLEPFIRNVHVKDARPVDPVRDAGYQGRVVTDLVNGKFLFVPVDEGITDNRALVRLLVAKGLDVTITVEAHVPDEQLDQCYRRGIELCRQEGVC